MLHQIWKAYIAVIIRNSHWPTTHLSIISSENNRYMSIFFHWPVWLSILHQQLKFQFIKFIFTTFITWKRIFWSCFWLKQLYDISSENWPVNQHHIVSAYKAIKRGRFRQTGQSIEAVMTVITVGVLLITYFVCLLLSWKHLWIWMQSSFHSMTINAPRVLFCSRVMEIYK